MTFSDSRKALAGTLLSCALMLLALGPDLARAQNTSGPRAAGSAPRNGAPRNAQDDARITLNFDNADIGQIIEAVANAASLFMRISSSAPDARLDGRAAHHRLAQPRPHRVETLSRRLARVASIARDDQSRQARGRSLAPSRALAAACGEPIVLDQGCGDDHRADP